MLIKNEIILKFAKNGLDLISISRVTSYGIEMSGPVQFGPPRIVGIIM